MSKYIPIGIKFPFEKSGIFKVVNGSAPYEGGSVYSTHRGHRKKIGVVEDQPVQSDFNLSKSLPSCGSEIVVLAVNDLLSYSNPTAGDMVPRTGGIRNCGGGADEP